MKILLLLVTAMLLNCSEFKKMGDQNTPLSDKAILETLEVLNAPEVLPHSHLLITFSSTKQSLFDYSLFKLGLVDIILEIEHEGEILRHSIFNKILPADIYLDDAVGVNLSPIQADEHLYQGFFKVPTGKLIKVETAFSGARTEIAIDDSLLTLTDSFFSLFAHEDEKNPDDLDIQRLAINTEYTLENPLSLKEGELQGFTINIDKDASFLIEPFESTAKDRIYAEFKPTFTVKPLAKKDEFLAPLKLRFFDYQNIDLSQDNGKLFIFGDPQDRLFISDITLDKATNVWFNGKETRSLTAVNGLYQIDLQGELSIDEKGYHYQLENAYLLNESNDTYKSHTYGRVLKKRADTIRIAGGTLPLKPNNYSHLGSRFISKTFEGSFTDLEEGDWVQFQYEKEKIKGIIKTSQKKTYEEATFLSFKTSLILPEKNLLNISLPIKNSFTLKAAIPCNEIIINTTETSIQTCSTSTEIETINLSENIDQVILIISRRGEFDTLKENGEQVFIQSPNQIFSYKERDDLKNKLEQLVQDEYRILSINAKGNLINSTFTANKFLAISLLAPHDTWDKDIDDQRKIAKTKEGVTLLKGQKLKQAGRISKNLIGFVGLKIKDAFTIKRKKYTKATTTSTPAQKNSGTNTTNTRAVGNPYSTSPSVERKNQSANTSPTKTTVIADAKFTSNLSATQTSSGRTISLNSAYPTSNEIMGVGDVEFQKPMDRIKRENADAAEVKKVIQEIKEARAKDIKSKKSSGSSSNYAALDFSDSPGKLTPKIPARKAATESIYTAVYVSDDGGATPIRPQKSQDFLKKAAFGGEETRVGATNPITKKMNGASSPQTKLIKNHSFIAETESYNNRYPSSNLSAEGPVFKQANTQRAQLMNSDFQNKHSQITSNIESIESKKAPSKRAVVNIEDLYVSREKILADKANKNAINQNAVEDTATKKMTSEFDANKKFSIQDAQRTMSSSIPIDPSAPALPPKKINTNIQTPTKIRPLGRR